MPRITRLDSTPDSAPEPRRKGPRDTVLVKIKVKDLVEKIGMESEIMVSRRSLGMMIAKRLG